MSARKILAAVVVVLSVGGACGGGGGESTPDAIGPGADAAPDALDLCSAPAALPRPFETLPGFTGAEDFAFDGDGWVVSSDAQGNIVRVHRDGRYELISPDVAGDLAGLRYLPGGDLIVASVSEGALIRITPDGSTRVILSGLDYPNGVDITADGSIYVAEQNAGRVRKVDPDTGEFTVVGLGMVNPNGVAVVDDGRTIFVGSFGGGTVYQIQLDDAGRPMTPRIFGRTPQAPTIAPPALPCEGLAEGTACLSTYGLPGTCEDYGGVLDCFGEDTCLDRVEGDRCVTTLGEPGRCEGATLACAAVDPCFGHGADDPCEDAYGFPGRCVAPVGGGPLACEEASCAGRAEGAPCSTAWGETSTCAVFEDVKLCFAVFPCEGVPDGSRCLDFHGLPGTCYPGYGGYSSCLAEPGCATSAAGERCLTPLGLFGTCTDGGGTLACTPANGCEGRVEGGLCELDEDLVGVCHDAGLGLTCTRRDPCVGLTAGSVCREADLIGVCRAADGGGLACETTWEPFLVPCDGLVLGDACVFEVDATTYDGACSDFAGRLFCQAGYDVVTPCAGLASGDRCEIASPYTGAIPGTCADDGGTLACGMPDPGDGIHGGLDGIATDACGHVYVTEYLVGQVWRFSPDGATTELVAELPSQWIPNLHWGTGEHGWEENTLWVADREGGRMFGLDLGVPGVPEVFP